MTRDDAVKKSDEALSQLAQALEQGKSESLVRYLDTLSKFHRYSFRNCLLIAIQKPHATRVAGFHKWKELGRRVKKNEQGIAILAPVAYCKRKAHGDPQETRHEENPNVQMLFGYKTVHVFDVSQTEGKKLPTLDMAIDGDPGERLARLEAIVRGKGIELTYSDMHGGALGTSAGGHITVLPTLAKAEKFSVLLHELAHSLMHCGNRPENTTKTIRETEAEAVAYVVCRACGLECSQNSADYIQLYSGDKDVLFQSLELIRGVAAGILSELEHQDCQEKSSKNVQHAA